jgi:hypothetical protein
MKYSQGEYVGHLQKSATSTIRLHKHLWDGDEYYDLREWVMSEGGELCPSKKGFRFRADLLEKIVELLRHARQ